MKLSIVIPAHNEGKRIRGTLRAYSDFFEEKRKSGVLDYEILIVLNNISDNTEEVVKECIKDNKRMFYVHLIPGGKGFAVIEGFKNSLTRENDLIGFVDADFATGPESFYLLVEKIGRSDCAIASRYLKDSRMHPPNTFRRAIVATGFNLIMRFLFFLRISDSQCGAKLLKRDATSFVVDRVKMSRWAFDVEMLYYLQKRGYLTREVETVWTDVAGGSINILKDSIRMFLALAQLRLINSPFKRLMRPFRIPIGLLWRAIS